jgi:hypothetical protein
MYFFKDDYLTAYDIAKKNQSYQCLKVLIENNAESGVFVAKKAATRLQRSLRRFSLKKNQVKMVELDSNDMETELSQEGLKNYLSKISGQSVQIKDEVISEEEPTEVRNRADKSSQTDLLATENKVEVIDVFMPDTTFEPLRQSSRLHSDYELFKLNSNVSTSPSNAQYLSVEPNEKPTCDRKIQTNVTKTRSNSGGHQEAKSRCKTRRDMASRSFKSSYMGSTESSSELSSVSNEAIVRHQKHYFHCHHHHHHHHHLYPKHYTRLICSECNRDIKHDAHSSIQNIYHSHDVLNKTEDQKPVASHASASDHVEFPAKDGGNGERQNGEKVKLVIKSDESVDVGGKAKQAVFFDRRRILLKSIYDIRRSRINNREVNRLDVSVDFHLHLTFEIINKISEFFITVFSMV